jgi:hypothetical protein
MVMMQMMVAVMEFRIDNMLPVAHESPHRASGKMAKFTARSRVFDLPSYISN